MLKQVDAGTPVPEPRAWHRLNDGRSFRLFNVLDDFNRDTLEHVIQWHGKPKVIRCENGLECISGA